MEFEVTDRSKVIKEVAITVPAADVSERLSAVTRDFARSVRLPGFRKGKAPVSLVSSKYASDIRGEVVDRLMPDTLQKVLAQTDLAPIGSPRVIQMDELSDDEPFRFTVAVEVLPEIELGDYTGIEYDAEEIEVTDEAVQHELEGLRHRGGVLSPVEGGASEGDILTVSVTASGEGVETKKTENHELTVGNSPLEELNEKAIGAKAGDRIEFEKQWGEDAPNEDVRGKLVHYEIEVSDVRKLELPPVDDELAKMVGFDTLEELKSDIRQKLADMQKREQDNSIRTQLSDGLIERHELEVPSALVEEETNRSMQEYARYLATQGIDPRYAEIDWEQIHRNLAVEAEKRVKRTLLLDAIAKKENLAVTDSEIEQKVMEQAGEQDGPEVLSRLRASGEIEGLRQTFVRDKAMDLVRESAKRK